MTYSPELLAAVAVLDQDQPGWWRKIDLAKLNMDSCMHCVIGQVFGVHYEDSPEETLSWSSCVYRLAKGATVSRVLLANTFSDEGGNGAQWRALITERNAADRIGETLAVPYPRERTEMIEGVAV